MDGEHRDARQQTAHDRLIAAVEEALKEGLDMGLWGPRELAEAATEAISADPVAVLTAFADGLVARGLRVDQDLPEPDDAYVIRIEAADGRRLLSRVSKTEVADLTPSDRSRLVALKSNGLATVVLTAQGHVIPGVERQPADA